MPQGGSFVMHFQPAVEIFDGQKVQQFRGIPYGRIPSRFANPEAISYDNLTDKVDCTKYGPICPQVSTDFHHLLRIPESIKAQEPPLQQDEFGCLNLDITVPATPSRRLPVLIWIHGGSQVMTFMPASSPCADTVPFVANSIKEGEPMILVFVNYRLNIFAFGNGHGSKNLALKDQRLAVEWVAKNIELFGGDPNNMTLGGESAGAVYVHAHMITGAPVQRAILQSGSLYLSPPQDMSRGDAMCGHLEEILAKDGLSLASAPVQKLLGALIESKIVSMWLQLTEDLQGWETRMSHVEELLVGDVEYESVIWRNGVEAMTAAEIEACFDSDIDNTQELKRLYNIIIDRPTACKLGALDFINDVRFAYPVMAIKAAYRQAGKTVYDYVFDQANPWQSSSRAHHAVELTMLFGRLDFTENAAVAAVQQSIRNKWVTFCNGHVPWLEKQTYAFGPHGRCGNITDSEYESRRRTRACATLGMMGPARCNEIFVKLAAGRISLLN
ncbi:Alpha/Beta hydrolase protein [Bisporella sp. PMI_857]|nr:Alpha/Beta hydrolase protein [Bisporella sp. PMI_857]